MTGDKSTQWYLVLLGRFIAILIVLSSGYPGLLRAQDRCASMQSLPSSSETGTDLTSRCLECHDYRENHHPIGIAPSDFANYPFPLYNGKVMCLTCHIEDHLGGSVNLLREGPYEYRQEFCFKCHAEKIYEAIDPHIMLDDHGREISVKGQSICLFCHSVKPNPATDRAEDVRFKADVAFLCWRCHPTMSNQKFFNEHFLAKPSGEMRRFIEGEKNKLQVTIPLVPRDRITCSTCHNPHQKGVILYPPASLGAGSEHMLRLGTEKICIACHNMM